MKTTSSNIRPHKLMFSVTSCGTLPSPQNGALASLSQRVGDAVTITCDACFTVSNTRSPTVSMTTECLPTGDWLIQPQCIIVTCPVLLPSQGSYFYCVHTRAFNSVVDTWIFEMKFKISVNFIIIWKLNGSGAQLI